MSAADHHIIARAALPQDQSIFYSIIIKPFRIHFFGNLQIFLHRKNFKTKFSFTACQNIFPRLIQLYFRTFICQNAVRCMCLIPENVHSCICAFCTQLIRQIHLPSHLPLKQFPEHFNMNCPDVLQSAGQPVHHLPQKFPLNSNILIDKYGCIDFQYRIIIR